MQKLEFKWAIKALDYEKKAAGGSGKLTIEGFASTPDRDRVKDIVIPQAFQNYLAKFLETGTMLLNHDPSTPVGRWTEAKVTDAGLYVKGFISETEKDLQTKIKEGIYSTLSIGFNTLEQEWNAALESNVIKELELLEVSVVTIPANPEARFQVAEVQAGKSLEVDAAKALSTEAVLGAFIIDELADGTTYNYKYVRGLVAKSLAVDENELDQAYVAVILNEEEDAMNIKQSIKEIQAQLETEKKSTTVETTEVKETPVAETKSAPSLEELAGIVAGLAEQIKSIEASITEVKSLVTQKSEVVEEAKAAKPKQGEDGSMCEEEEDMMDEEKKPCEDKKKEEVAQETKSLDEEEQAISALEAECLALENEILEIELGK
jgi:HK97 family phage prohead protease